MQFIYHKVQLETNIIINMIFMEEIKRLYQKLNYVSEKEREKLWKTIIDKNRALLNKQREELNKILRRK
ncbi:hypothetical protein LCGC14_0786680 [marine sediment metagenome]|uniref:Uncharacterized protein n=1 Tax=marine sediment metagenome TaxID=412755 RepID=A0A0F9PTY3_9ZZZZ